MTVIKEDVFADYEKVFIAMKEFADKYETAENQKDINNWIVEYLMSKNPEMNIPNDNGVNED